MTQKNNQTVISPENMKGISQSSKGSKLMMQRKLPKHIQLLKIVLQKNPQTRNNNDVVILNNFIVKNYFLDEISQKMSLDLSRNIIKNGKIYAVESGSVVCEMGKNVEAIYLVLEGKLGKTANKKIVSNGQKAIQFFEKINILIKQSNNFVKENKLVMKTAKSVHQKTAIEKFTQKIKLYELDIQSNIQAQQFYGIQCLIEQKQVYTENVVTMVDSIVLQISTIKLMQSLNQYKEKKLQFIVDKFLKASVAFKKIEQQKLKLLVQKCPLQKKKKGEYFYRQGQNAQVFYILLEGEVRLSKSIQLFQQNPNNLYINRSYLVGQNQCKDSLPYANLKEVFNYYPQKKLFHLGILSDLSIFGQEQVFENIPREVNTQVITIEASAYRVEGKIIQLIIGDKKPNINDFKQVLYDTLTKNKILYRQEKLASMLAMSNANNMKYFYIDSQKQLKGNSIQSFQKNRTQNLKKINNFITPQKTISKKQQNGPKHQPYFSKHNFYKMRTASTQRNSFSQKKHQSIDERKLTNQELNLSELTHSVQMISKSVTQRASIGDKMHLNKYSIDVKNPLIDVVFFTNVKKQSLRIQNTYRKKRFSQISQRGSRIQTGYKSNNQN